jgi:hypothetical protein
MREKERGDIEDERRGRESTECGVSVEGEYTFISAVLQFTRMARNEEYFKGERIRNVREQLAMRARLENQGKVKRYVVAVGASEMVRVMEKMEKEGSKVIVTGPRVKVKGEWMEEMR